MTRLNVPPGVHGPKGTRGQSQYGKQLREKQKVKRFYGIMENQFRKYVTEAFRGKGNTGEALLINLEKRLDNVVYRLGFTPSRPSARQVVSHRHVLVNGKKVNIPSYRISVGDTVTLDAKGLLIPEVKKSFEAKDFKLVSWLAKKAAVGKVLGDPKREDIVEPINEQDIVEFYSR
jgi:small subunit ribosomal protein S4